MSIEDDIIVKRPTKPEGPAQEPRKVEALCKDCNQPESNPDYHLNAPGGNWGAALHWFVPTATPAPSQPAGAREWQAVLDAVYSLVAGCFLEGDPYDTVRRSIIAHQLFDREENGRILDAVEAYAAQQTAAKDAEIRAKDAVIDALTREHDAAERERDSLREAVEQADFFLTHSGNQRAIVSGAYEKPSGRWEQFQKTKRMVSEALAALKAGKEGQ